MFGAILGTGVGGGIVVEGKALTGANATAGEWPQPAAADAPGGRPAGHLWVRQDGLHRDSLAGAALARDHRNVGGGEKSAADVARLAGRRARGAHRARALPAPAGRGGWPA